MRISDEAMQIVEAARESDGQFAVLYSDTTGGMRIAIGKHVFVDYGMKGRVLALWRGALKDLLDGGLIEKESTLIGHHGDTLYRLTREGWEWKPPPPLEIF